MTISEGKGVDGGHIGIALETALPVSTGSASTLYD